MTTGCSIGHVTGRVEMGSEWWHLLPVRRKLIQFFCFFCGKYYYYSSVAPSYLACHSMRCGLEFSPY